MIHVGKRVVAHRAPWRNQFEIYVIDDRLEGRQNRPHLLQCAGDTATWEAQQEGFAFACPSFALSTDAAQDLFDMLWQGGLRPIQQINESSRIEAVTRHLEDMRAIAFDRLKIARN